MYWQVVEFAKILASRRKIVIAGIVKEEEIMLSSVLATAILILDTKIQEKSTTRRAKTTTVEIAGKTNISRIIQSSPIYGRGTFC